MSSFTSAAPTWWLVWQVGKAWNALDFDQRDHAESFQETMEIKGGAVVIAKTRILALRLVKPKKEVAVSLGA